MTSPLLLRRLRTEDEVIAERAAMEAETETHQQLSWFYRYIDSLKADRRIQNILDVRRPRGLDGRVCVDPAVVILDDLARSFQRAMACQRKQYEHKTRAAIMSETRAAVEPINAVLEAVRKP